MTPEELRAFADNRVQCGHYETARKLNEAADEIERLQKRVEELERDAKRYRWLRERIANPVYCTRSTEWGPQHICREPLDAEIDAAMEAE